MTDQSQPVILRHDAIEEARQGRLEGAKGPAQGRRSRHSHIREHILGD
jgi:hypothetical protein